MTFVRIRLEQVNHEDPSPMIINLDLGSDRKPSKAIPQSGWWGIPKGNSWCRPVIFRPDGMVDFGGDPEDSEGDRYAEMQIFNRVFELGESFYMKDLGDGEVSQFVVREIIDLSE